MYDSKITLILAIYLPSRFVVWGFVRVVSEVLKIFCNKAAALSEISMLWVLADIQIYREKIVLI